MTAVSLEGLTGPAAADLPVEAERGVGAALSPSGLGIALAAGTGVALSFAGAGAAGLRDRRSGWG